MPDPTVNTSLRPIQDSAFGYDEARHLLLRAGFGGTPAQIRLLASWGPERAVDHLLDTSEIEVEAVTEDAFDKDIMRPPTPEEREAARRARQMQDEETLAQLQLRRQRSEREDRRQMVEIRKWWLVRLIESGRPLEEKMTLFWHGHFATSYRTIENSYHMYMQNQLFRAHALGNYGELLHDIIRDPAMLQYLNNDRNVASRPNENLAREIMELFSLGEGSYTEQDIKEGARALTGYTYSDDGFMFNNRVHDQGSKRILGRSGDMDGDDFCDAILAERACSEFMSWKLYDYFVRHLPEPSRVDAPTKSVLRQLAGTFRSS
ncbi:MAG: DUF1800 family protein, partial [Phycisphaerales bacterium]|nr:DUF1800 family protein [Phycisphaerales bacterium]